MLLYYGLWNIIVCTQRLVKIVNNCDSDGDDDDNDDDSYS